MTPQNIFIYMVWSFTIFKIFPKLIYTWVNALYIFSLRGSYNPGHSEESQQIVKLSLTFLYLTQRPEAENT